MNERYFSIPGSDRKFDRNWMLAVLLVSLMLSLLQVSSVNNLLPSIQGALGASKTGIQLVLSGYALAVGITLVPTGRLGDLFGRSGMWVIGMFIFTAASLGCGLADNSLQLNIMRVIQGIGAGFYSPQVSGLIQQYFQGRARARAFGLMGLVVAMSVALGPLISGALVGVLGPEIGWRYSFFVNVPIGIVGIIAAFRFLPFRSERRRWKRTRSGAAPDKSAGSDSSQLRIDSGETPQEKAATGNTHRLDLDPLGMILLVLAVLGVMLPFMMHGIAWRYVLLPVAACLLVIWVWWERHYARIGRLPMVDMRLFRIQSFAYCTAIGGLQFLGSSTIFVVVALFIQQGLDASALDVGLMGLPYAVLSGCAALWAGNRALEKGKEILVFSLAIILAGLVLVGFVAWGVADLGWSHWLLTLAFLPLGFGAGCMGSASQTTAMMDVPVAYGGTAGGVLQTTQRIATAIGNALITGVLFTTYRGGETAADWFVGLLWAIVVIAVFIAGALGVAVAFRRKHSSGNA